VSFEDLTDKHLRQASRAGRPPAFPVDGVRKACSGPEHRLPDNRWPAERDAAGEAGNSFDLVGQPIDEDLVRDAPEKYSSQPDSRVDLHRIAHRR